MELTDTDPAANGLVRAVVDFERLGGWVRFQADIGERETSSGPQPAVLALCAKNDDGMDVPIGVSEHQIIVAMFLKAYNRWRGSHVRSV